MKKFFNIIILVLFIPNLIFSQLIIPKIDWYKIYDGPKNSVDLTNDIQMDNLYNMYLCGRSVGLNGTDLLILEYSEFGDSLLELKYNSAPQSWNEAFSLAIDSDNNIYVVGIATFEQNTFYAIFHKYSSNGKLIWAKDFYDDININSEGKQVILNSKNQPIIGYNQTIFGQSSAKIIKYTPSGDSVWIKSFDEDDTSSYSINCLIADSNNNIYAAINQSYYNGGDLPSTRLFFIKINDSGNIIWGKKFDNVYVKKIIYDKENNLILLAADSKILKLNSLGDTLWTKEYPSINDVTIISDLAVDTNNDIIFTGYGGGEETWDYYTQKLSSEGKDVWTQMFNSDENMDDFSRSVVIDKYDNIYVTGEASDYLFTGACYTLKYSNDGRLLWKLEFRAPLSDYYNCKKIFIDDSNNVFIGGDVADSLNGWNFLALKIKQARYGAGPGTNDKTGKKYR